MSEDETRIDVVSPTSASPFVLDKDVDLFDFIEDSAFNEKTGLIIFPSTELAFKLTDATDMKQFFVPFVPVAYMNPQDYDRQEIYDISQKMKDLDEFVGDTAIGLDVAGYIEKVDGNYKIEVNNRIKKKVYQRRLEKGFWTRTFPVLWAIERGLYELNLEKWSRNLSEFIRDKEQNNGVCLSRFRLCPYCGQNSVDKVITEPNEMSERIAVCKGCEEWISSTRKEDLERMMQK